MKRISLEETQLVQKKYGSKVEWGENFNSYQINVKQNASIIFPQNANWEGVL